MYDLAIVRREGEGGGSQIRLLRTRHGRFVPKVEGVS